MRGAGDIYLPPERARGARYCLDPDSEALRDIIGRGAVDADAPIERRALARDVEALHEILQKQYAGYPELLQHRRFDVAAFFARWADELRAGAGSIRFEDGVIHYIAALKRAHLDRHLQPLGWGARLAQRPALAMAEYQAPSPCEDLTAYRFPDHVHGFVHTLRRSAMLMPDGALADIATATAQGHHDETLTLGCGAAGENPIELTRRGDLARADASDAPLYEWRSEGDTALIIIRRLHGSPEQLALLERIAEDYDAHRAHGTIVFDFRDNGGGDDGYLFQWLERAYAGTLRLPPSIEIEGALHPCRDWNAAVFAQISHDVVDTAEAVARRDELCAEWPAAVPDIHHSVSSGLLESEAKDPYDGRVIALVNRRSASSGESAPVALRSALGALIVGERTAGYLEYGNLQPFVLPHTGLVFLVPIKRSYYDPPAEGVGLAVDYYLDPSLMQEPAEALLPLLDQLPATRAHIP